MIEENTHQFKLIKIIQETEDISSFIFIPEGDKAFTWEAGQIGRASCRERV